MNKWLNNDRLSGLILMLSSVVLFFLIIPEGIKTGGCPTSAGLSPTFMPNLVTTAIGVLAFFLIIKKQDSQSQAALILFPLQTTITMFIFILYIILVPFLGYLVSTLCFLPVILIFFGSRNWIHIIPLSIVLPLFLYWFFSKIMFVLLPTGFLI